MRHFAANYIFDGEKLIKNSYVSLNEKNEIIYVAGNNEALIEKPRMIFYNGIISPAFIADNDSLESQRKVLQEIKEIFRENKTISLIDSLKIFTNKKATDTSSQLYFNLLKSGNKIQIILLQNVDLLNLKLKDDTFVKILC